MSLFMLATCSFFCASVNALNSPMLCHVGIFQCSPFHIVLTEFSYRVIVLFRQNMCCTADVIACYATDSLTVDIICDFVLQFLLCCLHFHLLFLLFRIFLYSACVFELASHNGSIQLLSCCCFTTVWPQREMNAWCCNVLILNTVFSADSMIDDKEQ